MRPPGEVRCSGLGVALPAHAIDQADAAAMASRLVAASPAIASRIERLYRSTTVMRRHLVILDDAAGACTFYRSRSTDEPRGPDTAARLARYRDVAPDLAVVAARGALSRAGRDAGSIEHLVTVTCTGFAAPGLDLALVDRLGLGSNVSRTHIGFMGCHGALNGLRVASALASTGPVLLCAAELCSLHLNYATDHATIIGNALFADGAAAAVIESTGAGIRLIDQFSEIVPATATAMQWIVGNHGFEMTLDARVPEHVAATVRPLLDARLKTAGLGVADVAHWIVHPGGPAILDAIEARLGLGPGILDASREMLRTRGNLSSATVLFILDDLLRAGLRGPVVMLAFGPGMTIEGAVFLPSGNH
ncbi:MAG: type III polyketide synthase [Phycisphaerales bacterium]|nr:type III polyketide synthase [Phycisphaerales bacterium]